METFRPRDSCKFESIRGCLLNSYGTQRCVWVFALIIPLVPIRGDPSVHRAEALRTPGSVRGAVDPICDALRRAIYRDRSICSGWSRTGRARRKSNRPSYRRSDTWSLARVASSGLFDREEARQARYGIVNGPCGSTATRASGPSVSRRARTAEPMSGQGLRCAARITSSGKELWTSTSAFRWMSA